MKFLESFNHPKNIRFESFKTAIKLADERNLKTIVETGAARGKIKFFFIKKFNWKDGMSTLLFSEYARYKNGHLHTCDIEKKNVSNAKFFCKKNEEFCSRLIKLHLSNQKEWPEPFNLEDRIFESFPSHQDKKLMIDFHIAPNDKKYEIAKQFKDDRYKEIAVRILYEIAPHTLPENDKRNYEFEIKERFNDDDKSKWNSKNKILSILETDLDKMIIDEDEKIQFKQKVITFLNNESAKWN